MNLNIGISLSFWITFIQIALLFFFLIKLGFTIKNYIVAQKWKEYDKIADWLIVIVVYFVLISLSHGPGKIQLYGEQDKKTGYQKRIEKTREENIDSIRKITEEEKPHSLKRQEDSGFEEERRQSEEYLKSLNLN